VPELTGGPGVLAIIDLAFLGEFDRFNTEAV